MAAVGALLESGAEINLKDKLGETARRQGRYKPWEKMVFSQVQLTALMVEMMTGQKCVVDVDEDDPEYDKKATDFLQKLLKNGLGDILGFGSTIVLLNVVEIFLTGKLAEGARSAPKSVQTKRPD